MNKEKRTQKVYPNIADSILTSVCLPVVPHSVRKTFTRPDTLRLFVPPEQDYESDEEVVREKEREKIKDKYRKKSIKKVAEKIKNETGQVMYKIVWLNSRSGDFEIVPSKGLQDHPDWALVEAFEYFKAKNMYNSINGDPEI
ncbi:hypothetical protein INT48_000827 [Thamnidium elegans]|uniref:Chromo domain-containing protein n=1 Tax=Thamnidium elegans TaxID=101142 RepID=A0A8H7VYX6_9FUNG|nr:hypothetical protein INT48_000827 [Thamnidium elegans]